MSSSSPDLRHSSSNGSSQESLLTALNKFVQAVDSMDDRVMVPSRLKDMSVTDSDTDRPMVSEKNNNMALVPSITPGTDLFGFYSLLNTIKTELITGTKSEEDHTQETEAPEGVIDDNDASKKTAQVFKHHLSGLFSVLHQMTETAKYLTVKYESEIGENSSKSLSSLTI
ncbi:hypothetical protein FSP39_018909 [Pinctada imbricata]|uniref:Uncharacterized protein n=1 Tax=Pinctada imbricata TaxID=66713 RepID=A0AA89BTY1_PINIB|nr:hypothetical protein FSP39_018909 [Pinctada imbricata]